MSFQVIIIPFYIENNLLFYQKGTSRQSLTFAQNEGEVNTINSNGSFLVMGSTKGHVKVFDISRR